MATITPVIDKKALEESLKAVTSSIEKAFSSSLANVTKGITSALFLLARPSIVQINTNKAEKNLKEIESQIKLLDNNVQNLNNKEQLELCILKDKKKLLEMTNRQREEEKTKLKEIQKELEAQLKLQKEQLKNQPNEDLTQTIKINTGALDEVEAKLDKLKKVKSLKFELFIQGFEQIDKGLRAAAGLGNAVVAFQEQITQNQLVVLEKSYNAQQTLSDKASKAVISGIEKEAQAKKDIKNKELEELKKADEEADEEDEAKREEGISKIEEDLQTKKDLIQTQLEELDTNDEERRALEAELAAAATEEEKLQAEQKLIKYQEDAAKKAQLNSDMAALDKQAALDKDAFEIEMGEAAKLRSEESATRKAELEKSIADAEKQAALDKKTEEDRLREEKAKAEKKYLHDKAVLERKQAESAKAMKLVEAGINMASAILAATLSGLSAPWPISMVMVPLLVAMAAATGGVQIATIANTPLPEIPSFSSGGLVPGSNDHLFPQLPKSKNSQDRTLAWLSEGEMVLTRNQTEMYNNIRARDTFNNTSNSNINHITNDIKIYADNKTNTKLLAKQVVLEISRGYA